MRVFYKICLDKKRNPANYQGAVCSKHPFDDCDSCEIADNLTQSQKIARIKEILDLARDRFNYAQSCRLYHKQEYKGGRL